MSALLGADVCPKGRPTDLEHWHLCWWCGRTVSCASDGKVWVALEDARTVMVCRRCFDPRVKPPESPGPGYVAALRRKRRSKTPKALPPAEPDGLSQEAVTVTDEIRAVRA